MIQRKRSRASVRNLNREHKWYKICEASGTNETKSLLAGNLNFVFLTFVVMFCGVIFDCGVSLNCVIAKITENYVRKISSNKLPDFTLRPRGRTLGIDSFFCFNIIIFLFYLNNFPKAGGTQRYISLP